MGSNPTVFTKAPVPKGFGVFSKWLRSTEVVHYLGKIEVTSSNLVGASSVKRFNIALDVLLVAQAGVRKLPICFANSIGRVGHS